jgi:voltage-gated potassium channel
MPDATVKVKATRRMSTQLWAFWLIFAALWVAYALQPVDGRDFSVNSLVMYLGGLVILTAVVMVMAVREYRGSVHASQKVRVIGLVLLIVGATAFFCVSYYRVAQVPGQFEELHTVVDSVYFVLATTLTIGYGDVHASGQIARAEVIAEMLFNVIVLATAVRLLSTVLKSRRPQQEPHRPSRSA